MKNFEKVIRTAKSNFGVELTKEQATQILKWDEDGSFVGELDDTGVLDTAPRDYFSMALIETLMPGPPTVQDDFLPMAQTKWHWPCYGSSPEYTRAFRQVWNKVIKQPPRPR